MSPCNPTHFIISSFCHPVPPPVPFGISSPLLISPFCSLTPYLLIFCLAGRYMHFSPRNDTVTFMNVPVAAEWNMRVKKETDCVNLNVVIVTVRAAATVD